MHLVVGSNNVHCCDDQFCCDSIRCITRYWVCDGIKDCSGGTGEDPKECVSTTCSLSHFTCAIRLHLMILMHVTRIKMGRQQWKVFDWEI